MVGSQSLNVLLGDDWVLERFVADLALVGHVVLIGGDLVVHVVLGRSTGL